MNALLSHCFGSTEVDNFGCTWIVGDIVGDGWPQRSQLQPGVPSLGRCVTSLPTFCNLALDDPLPRYNKRIVFISYRLLLCKARLDRNQPRRLVGSPLCQCVEQFDETRLVKITHGGFAIWLNPFGMLTSQVVVNLLPKLNVGMDLVSHRHCLR